MQRSIPKQPHAPKQKPDPVKLRGSVESDEGPALRTKLGYRNSDEMETATDARHDDPTGV
jgi:hypothetical protein